MAEPGTKRAGKPGNKGGLGGRRAGAGRKPGSQTSKVAKIAMAVTAEGIQPIEVIIKIMRKAWDEGDFPLAARMADSALPYTTPRLAATTVTHKDALGNLSDGDLAALLAFARTVTTAAIAGLGDGSEEEGTRVSH